MREYAQSDLNANGYFGKTGCVAFIQSEMRDVILGFGDCEELAKMEAEEEIKKAGLGDEPEYLIWRIEELPFMDAEDMESSNLFNDRCYAKALYEDVAELCKHRGWNKWLIQQHFEGGIPVPDFDEEVGKLADLHALK